MAGLGDPKSGVRRRRVQRAARLRSLGFASYPAYLRSSTWANTKRRYRESELPQDCFCCGETEVDLHHKTYVRVAEEQLTDLVPLCRNCHQLVHVLERRGDLTLDLQGLLDTARAQRYAMERQPMVERAKERIYPTDFTDWRQDFEGQLVRYLRNARAVSGEADFSSPVRVIVGRLDAIQNMHHAKRLAPAANA